MKADLRTAVWFVAICSTAASLCGQSDGPPAPLLIPLDVSGWQDPLSDPSIVQSRPVLLNFDPAVGLPLNTLLTLKLFDDLTLTVLFDQIQPRNPSEYSGAPVQPIGVCEQGWVTGANAGFIAIVTEPGRCFADIAIPDLGTFQIVPCDGLHIVRELASTPLDCGTQEIDSALFEQLQAQGAFQPQEMGPQGGGEGSDPEAECDDGSTVDIVVLYTPAAVQFAGGESIIQMQIQGAVDFANTAYANSLISTHMRLLYKGPIDYDDEDPDGALNLARLSDPWDGYLDEVLPLRNALRPDLVQLWTGIAIPTGISNLLGPNSVVVAGRGRGLAHETGHNFGCAHDRGSYPNCVNNCNCVKGVFPWSFGYCFYPPPNYTYGDILSVCGNIPYYANPDVSWPSGPTGVPTGVPAFNQNGSPNCNSADLALTMNQTKSIVAKFRISADRSNTTRKISNGLNGAETTGGHSLLPSISSNGQWIAFASSATNVTSNDTNGTQDIFLFDAEAQTTLLISRQTGNGPIGNAYSGAPTISGNGRFVVFETDAGNLTTPGAPQDINGKRDIYIRGQSVSTNDRDTKRLSVSSNGSEAHDNSFAPSISESGRFVVFESDASDLFLPDNGLARDIFLRDRDKDGNGLFDESGTANVDTSRITFGGDGLNQANGSSFAAAISADGNWIAFESDATNLLPTNTDTNGKRDIFVRHRTGGTTIRMSVGDAGQQSNGHNYSASISKTGRYIAFHSEATNLLQLNQDSNGKLDVFVHDRDTDNNGTFDELAGTATYRVSVGPLGVQGDADSYDASMAADGRYVAFTSEAANFDTVTTGIPGTFVRDLQASTTFRVSVSSTGDSANGGSLRPAISDDGRYIAFDSLGTNLVLPVPDTNGYADVFFRDRGPQLIGDLNGDKHVNAIDEDILVQNWGTCACCAADLDHNGTVNSADLLKLTNNWTG